MRHRIVVPRLSSVFPTRVDIQNVNRAGRRRIEGGKRRAGGKTFQILLIQRRADASRYQL